MVNLTRGLIFRVVRSLLVFACLFENLLASLNLLETPNSHPRSEPRNGLSDNRIHVKSWHRSRLRPRIIHGRKKIVIRGVTVWGPPEGYPTGIVIVFYPFSRVAVRLRPGFGLHIHYE